MTASSPGSLQATPAAPLRAPPATGPTPSPLPPAATPAGTSLSECVLPPRSLGLPWPGCPSTPTTKEVPMPRPCTSHTSGVQARNDPDLHLEFPDNTPLYPNQTYWAVFEEVSGLGVYEISTAPNGDEDPDSWPISDTSLQRNFFSLTGRTWQASALNPIAMVVDGYPVEERVLVGAHGLRDTAADGPFLRFGTERVTKVWLNLPKGRTYDGGATNASIRLDCEPRFVEGPDTETSWRLCSTNKTLRPRMGRRARVHHRPQPDRLHYLRPRGGHRRPERDVGPGSGHLRRRGVQLPRGRARPPVAPGQLPGDRGHRRFA